MDEEVITSPCPMREYIIMDKQAKHKRIWLAELPKNKRSYEKLAQQDIDRMYHDALTKFGPLRPGRLAPVGSKIKFGDNESGFVHDIDIAESSADNKSVSSRRSIEDDIVADLAYLTVQPRYAGTSVPKPSRSKPEDKPHRSKNKVGSMSQLESAAKEASQPVKEQLAMQTPSIPEPEPGSQLSRAKFDSLTQHFEEYGRQVKKSLLSFDELVKNLSQPVQELIKEAFQLGEEQAAKPPRTHGKFGVPYRGKQPQRPAKLDKNTVLAHVLEDLQELHVRLDAYAGDPGGPDAAVQVAYTAWRDCHPNKSKKRKGQHWTARWQQEITKEIDALKAYQRELEPVSISPEEAEAKRKEACDCGNYPYCSPVCVRRLPEREICTCKAWPLCECWCPLWQANQKVHDATYKKIGEVRKTMKLPDAERNQLEQDQELLAEIGAFCKGPDYKQSPGFFRPSYSEAQQKGGNPVEEVIEEMYPTPTEETHGGGDDDDNTILALLDKCRALGLTL